MRIALGDHLGPFEIVALIGSGGMGEVYRARDPDLNRDVALKVLSREFALDAKRLSRLTREARVLASLQHPNIAGIYGLEGRERQDGEPTGGPFALVLELVEGITLAQRIGHGPIPTAEALTLANQIVDALEAAHGKGIVHRDLKPSNVMISTNGVVKVLDFGIAKIEGSDVARPDAQTHTATALTAHQVIGTVPYMSPEQARGQSVDTRSDIWSFGCVLFEMITGRSAFARNTPSDTLAAILTHEPDWQAFSEAAPSTIRRLVQRCLEKDPRRRLRDIGDARGYVEEAGSSSTQSHHNLPSEVTSFVGRRTELETLARLLASSRLVSITGSGGVGKTRLALRLARDVQDQFADGVWFVDLAPIVTPTLVVQAIASAVGVHEPPQRSVREAVIDHLRDRTVLLVLDTCEHLIEECAALADTLLRQAPALRIVATSREILSVPGESVWRVASLTQPDASVPPTTDSLSDFEATQLFVERAQSMDPDFTVAAEQVDTVRRICRYLDGIPLAIELAAARITALSLEQIESRLQDRFRLLTGGARTVSPRQRTLEATVQWSYQLLSDEEREVLNRLSVFPAAWTLEAAERVCESEGIEGDSIGETVFRLVNKSLVGRDNVGRRRYRLLDTVRHYGRERLVAAGLLDRVRDTHLHWMHEEFRDAFQMLQGRAQADWLRRIAIERDNLRVALEWALSSPTRAALALDLAVGVFRYWMKRGEFAEGRAWLERALAVTAGTRSRARARALVGLAGIVFFQGHTAEVATAATEALALGRETDDAWVVSYALYWLSLVAFERREHSQGVALATEARNASQGDASVVLPLSVLALFAMSQGDYDRAEQLANEACDVSRRAGDISSQATLLCNLAVLRMFRKDFESARVHLSEALTFNEELEDPRGLVWTLEPIASLLVAGDRLDSAVHLWGAADTILQEIGIVFPPYFKVIRDRSQAKAKAALGLEGFQAAFAEGCELSSADAIAIARQELKLLR